MKRTDRWTNGRHPPLGAPPMVAHLVAHVVTQRWGRRKCLTLQLLTFNLFNVYEWHAVNYKGFPQKMLWATMRFFFFIFWFKIILYVKAAVEWLGCKIYFSCQTFFESLPFHKVLFKTPVVTVPTVKPNRSPLVTPIFAMDPRPPPAKARYVACRSTRT